jgi:hypothetical protein
MTLEEAVRKNPKRKLSVRQKIFSGLFGFLVALVYANLVWFMMWFYLRHGWSAYDLPTTASRLWDICFDVVLLPFQIIPFLDRFAVLLDIIFWGFIGGFIYAMFCSKRAAA